MKIFILCLLQAAAIVADGTSSCTDTYSSCSSYVEAGYCSTYFCPTCTYANYCDSSCDYCEDDGETSTTCTDTFSSCASYSSYCDTYFCDTCTYHDYCDAYCGFCEGDSTPVAAPVPSPTTDGCSNTYGYCDSYSDKCDTYFCPTCTYCGYCDEYCGFCDDDSVTRQPVPPPVPSPTQSPVEAGCSETYGYCESYVNGGYCDTYFCPTCYYTGYCDVSCGYCDGDGTQPVAAPSAAPVQPPTTSNGGGGTRTCFSGHDTVQMEGSGDRVLFKDLSVGDRIRSANRDGVVSYSSVVFLPHGENDIPTTFLEVITESSKKIKMTRGHLIQLCNGDLVSAHELSKDKGTKKKKNNMNCIRSVDGDESIKSIRQVHSQGVYTAVTENEFLVVNDIIASPFASSSGLVHAFFNLTDMEDWCSSNNWLVYERLRHPQLINVLREQKQKEDLVSPSSDCLSMLTDMFEKYKDEPVGWGEDGWGYRGWSNPSSFHKNEQGEEVQGGEPLNEEKTATANENMKQLPMPELITGWNLREESMHKATFPERK